MKRLIFNLFFLFSAFNLVTCKAEVVKEDLIFSNSDTLHIATYNVRIKTTGDTNERSWDKRKSFVAQLISSYRFDVFGVQELVNLAQEKDLNKLLPSYKCYSKGRDNNEGTSGERLSIYYNKNRFNVIDSGFFFLSPTPNVASKGWDAALNRICVWVKLYDTITKKNFCFFNVHFDHMGITARSESANLLISKVKEITGSETTYCVGDFNASPFETAVYDKMKSYFKDSKIEGKSEQVNSVGTFNNWDVNAGFLPESLRIDYVFYTKVKILTYKVLTDKYVAETYPSDHFPVMITSVIE